MQKDFVRFLSPNLFTGIIERPIDKWDVNEAIRISKAIGESGVCGAPYGFCFVTRSYYANGINSRVVCKSGMYYINGIVETLEEIVAQNNPENSSLIRYMRDNHWNRVIRTVGNNKWTQPFNPGDVLISVS